jgi:hypothetical protein
MPVGPPPAPTSLSATPKASSAEIAFTDPSSNGGSAITNYEYSLNGGSTWIALSPSDTITPLTISGLTDGTSYSIQIRALNSYGSGVSSASVSVTPGLIARLSNLVVASNPAKGVVTTISVSLNVAGKTNFLIDGRRIAGCYKVSTVGSGSNFTSTCYWKPAVMGRHVISVLHIPTDVTYASGTITSPAVNVVKRNTIR